MDFKIVDTTVPSYEELDYYNGSIALAKDNIQEAIDTIECFSFNKNLIDRNTNLPLNCELLAKFKYIITLLEDLRCEAIVKPKNMEDN